MSSFSEDGASEISAFASILLNEAFRRLPTNTHTFISLSIIIFQYDASVHSESGSIHWCGQRSSQPQQATNKGAGLKTTMNSSIAANSVTRGSRIRRSKVA